MKKLKTVIVLLFLLTLINLPVCAEWQVAAEVEVVGEKVYVTGTVNSKTEQQITILVRDSTDRIANINQFACEYDGSFSYNFLMPDFANSGMYKIYIGGTNVAPVFSGSFEYTKSLQSENIDVTPKFSDVTFASADLNIDINAYIPTIRGTVMCESGNKLILSILNETDNSTVISHEVVSETGEFPVNITLPGLLSEKNYSVLIEACDIMKNTTLATINLQLNTGLTLSLTGTSSVAENVRVNTDVTSNHSSIISKSGAITGTRTYDYSVVNLLSFASLNVSADFVEKRDLNPENNPAFSINKVEFFKGITFKEIDSLSSGLIRVKVETENLLDVINNVELTISLYNKETDNIVVYNRNNIMLSSNEKDILGAFFNIPYDYENYYIIVKLSGNVYGENVNIIRKYK